jgi:hypothetical protein
MDGSAAHSVLRIYVAHSDSFDTVESLRGKDRAPRIRALEPVFANTKFNRRIGRFQRRRLAACRAEWQLIAATLKLWRAALAPATS